MYQICIVGGGASGMATAIALAKSNPNMKMIILEKNDRFGKKLSATGNGRCNISNANISTFGDSCRFFRDIGVEIKTKEEGRAYPVSEQAKDVVYAMENIIDAYGIEMKKNYAVTDIIKSEDGSYKVITQDQVFNAQKVILATGGKAAPQFGTVGDGYKWAKSLGHRINKLSPALVALKCENQTLETISGVRAKCKVALYRDEFWIETEEGEIQFTKDGLSGICIFNLSSFVKLNESTNFEDYSLHLDLLHGYTYMEIFHILSMRREIEGMKTENIFLSLVNQEISKKILKNWSDKIQLAKNLSDKDIENIINSFKDVSFKVTGANGWREAQCTSGGISSEDFDKETMESKISKGLYFTGEIIDYDGPCGGFNLENAWNTSRKIGKAICFTE